MEHVGTELPETQRPPTQRLGIREVRSNIATVVKRAGAGQRVVITVGGRPVAQLGPIESDGRDRTIEELAAKGEVVLARREDRPEAEFSMPLWAGTRIDRLMREVRGR